MTARTDYHAPARVARRNNLTLAERVAGCRKIASEHRQLAENHYRETLAIASRWELYANLLEQGYELDEAKRRAFGPELAKRKETASANA